MPLINLTIQHGRTLEEASRRLETAVHEISHRFGALVRRVQWAADRNRVKLEGTGFWVELWVDAQAVHATGDLPILGALLGSPLASRLKQIVQQTFQKELC
jgi:putative polyhydroxyalkanoic acid system protein